LNLIVSNLHIQSLVFERILKRTNFINRWNLR